MDASPRPQSVTLENGRGKHRKYLPFAFTEKGVAMLSSVLRSPRAARVNIEIMRAFVRMRSLLGEHTDLSARIELLERKYDGQFKVVFDALRGILRAPRSSRRRIGFRATRP
jgi:hypothetical protein